MWAMIADAHSGWAWQSGSRDAVTSIILLVRPGYYACPFLFLPSITLARFLGLAYSPKPWMRPTSKVRND